MARSNPSRFLKFLAFAGVSLAILCMALQPVNALDFNFGRKPLEPSVQNALAQMKLTPKHLYQWQAESPKSLLLQIHQWPAEKQEMAAALALYIRSQNRNVSARDTWREAVAFVHYGEKYGLPVDMAGPGGKPLQSLCPKQRGSHGPHAGAMESPQPPAQEPPEFCFLQGPPGSRERSGSRLPSPVAIHEGPPDGKKGPHAIPGGLVIEIFQGVLEIPGPVPGTPDPGPDLVKRPAVPVQGRPDDLVQRREAGSPAQFP